LQVQDLEPERVLELVDGGWMNCITAGDTFSRQRRCGAQGHEDLPFKLPLEPPSLDGREHGELALVEMLHLVQEDQAVSPRQLCQQC
jgi:hypothetical protein